MSLVAPNVDIFALKAQTDSKRFSIAIFAWVVYELILTMGDCVDLFVLQGRWSIVKILFFVNRIVVLLITITTNALNFVSFESDYGCAVAMWAQFILTTLIISIVAFALASRVYALWKGYRVVLTFFFLLSSANILNYVILYGGALCQGTPIVSQPPYTGCYYGIPPNNFFWISFATTFIYEAIALILIIYKTWPVARQRGIKTPLFSLFLEHGVAYYLAFTVSKLFTVGAIYVPTAISPIIMSTYPSVPVAALIVNHFFIRLQRFMVQKPVIAGFTSADFSTVKDNSNGGNGSGPNEIDTIGGSGPTGRICANRHQNYDLSEGDVELGSPEDVHVVSTSQDDVINRPATEGMSQIR